MRKLLLIGIYLCISMYNTRAQSHEIRAWEAEIGTGITFGGDRLNFDRICPGASFLVEGRYNFTRVPVDVGLQVNASLFQRESKYAGEMRFKSWNILAVSDYNFFRTNRISLFAGAGFGYAYHKESAPILFDNTQPNWGGFSSGGDQHGVCFMPRIGAEFFHHLRLTFDYRVQEKANRHWNLTVGFVFGGGEK